MGDNLVPATGFRSTWFVVVVAIGLLALLAAVVAVAIWVAARPPASAPLQERGPITRLELIVPVHAS